MRPSFFSNKKKQYCLDQRFICTSTAYVTFAAAGTGKELEQMNKSSPSRELPIQENCRSKQKRVKKGFFRNSSANSKKVTSVILENHAEAFFISGRSESIEQGGKQSSDTALEKLTMINISGEPGLSASNLFEMD